MVSYASGTIRVPGLTSKGTQFDSMIQGLLKIEGRQVNKLLQWKNDWQTRLDAFKAIRGELMNLQTALNGLNTMDKFMIKAASSSDDKVLTATAGANAENTTYKVETGQLATYTTWSKDLDIQDKNTVVAEEKGSLTYSYKGIYRKVTVHKGTTLEGMVKLINNDSKNPGVRAELVHTVNGITLQIRGKDTGQTNTLVLREAENLKGFENFGITPSNYTDTENSAVFDKVFDSTNRNDKLVRDVVDADNDGVDDLDPNYVKGPKTFIFTMDGKRYTVDVSETDTIDDLVANINTKAGKNIASMVEDPPSSGNYKFTLERANTVYNPTWDTNGNITPPGPLQLVMGREDDGSNNGVDPMYFDNANAKVIQNGNGLTAGDWYFKINSNDGTSPNGQQYKVTVTEDTTLRGLANSLQFQFGSNATVSIKDNGSGQYYIDVAMKEKTHRLTVENGSLDGYGYVPPDPVDGSGWTAVHGGNAQYRINGYPKEPEWWESASNTLKGEDVIDGMTFNLKKENSTATISVTNDTAKMTENIMTFVNAVNTFRATLKAYTKYDDTKEVKDLDYAESQFEMQKGGVLQGNYGIQMVDSRLKNAVAGTSLGFTPLMKDMDGLVIGGDIFSSLSQIGISTNAKEGEAMFGMLELNLISGNAGSKTLQEALDQDAEAVAKLFATKSEGKSNSEDFHYYDHLSSITKSGNYTVSYTMSADGSSIASATIGGAKCTIDQEAGLITCTEGAAKGLVIRIGENDAGRTYTGTVSIKDGKINELLGLLEGSDGILGSNGTLRNLEKNYQNIIKGIDDKIKREDDRLTRFERTMTLKFARLEEVLSKYDGIQASLEQSLSQLTSNNK